MTPSRARAAVRPVVAAALVATLLAGCGGGSGAGDSAVTSTTGGSTTTTAAVKHSAPRWETVTTLSGSGSTTTEAFSILPGAIQWRTRWTCDAGSMRITTIPARKATDPPMVDAACRAEEKDRPVGYSIVVGKVKMAVVATGPWTIIVDQQIDTALEEPPLPGMEAAKPLGQGGFYDIEMTGKGTAKLYELPDGSRALRLEDFEVSNNTDLFVWLSESPDPRTSEDAVDAPYVEIGNLKSTLGNQNYVLPADLPADRIRSIVIWCAPVRIAYTAAVLSPPP